MPRGKIVEGAGHLQEQFGFGLADVRQRLLSATLSFFLEVVTLHTSIRGRKPCSCGVPGEAKGAGPWFLCSPEEMGLVQLPNLIN